MDLSKHVLSFVTLFVLVLAVFVNSEYTRNSLIKSKSADNHKPEGGVNLIETLKNQIRDKENELHKAEVLNKNFDRMIQLVNILGQVDSFLTEKTKVLIKKLAALAKHDEEEEKMTIKNAHL